MIPDQDDLASGEFMIQDIMGSQSSVACEGVAPFEITEAEAIRWAKQELADSLDELKDVIDDKLLDWQEKLDDSKRTPIKPDAKIIPDTANTFFDFLKQLPRLFLDSVSNDDNRLNQARKKAGDMQRRLDAAGLTSDDRLRNFPDRLAEFKRRSESNRRRTQ